MTYLLKLICFLISLLPETRCFKFKALILNKFGFRINKTCRIVSSLSIVGKPKLIIGQNTYIGHFFKCYGDAIIDVGSEVDIGPEVSLITGTHKVNFLGGKVAGIGRCDPIVIGDNSWVCAGVKVLGGTVIGRGSLVAPGSVVKGDFEEGVFIAGNPAKAICKLKDLYKNNEI